VPARLPLAAAAAARLHRIGGGRVGVCGAGPAGGARQEQQEREEPLCEVHVASRTASPPACYREFAGASPSRDETPAADRAAGRAVAGGPAGAACAVRARPVPSRDVYVPLLFLALPLLWLGIRLAAGSMDKERIEGYITHRGGRVVSITWAPLGRGWFGEKDSRIYKVVYDDKDGRRHFATAKTSMFSGVYWTEDAVTHDRPPYEQVPKTNEPGHPVLPEVGKANAGGGSVQPVADPFGEMEFLRRENQRMRDELAKRDAPAPKDPPRSSRDYEPRRPQ
jgi:hypothetical protein